MCVSAREPARPEPRRSLAVWPGARRQGKVDMSDRRNDRPAEGQGLETLQLDYRYEPIPDHVREIIDTHLAIEAEDAKTAGQLGFMTRALAMATMPHRRPRVDVYERRNGDFCLRMWSGSAAGLPYGTLPRLLVSWVCTEAVTTRSRELCLGPSLAQFLEELGLSRTGGVRGNITRVRDQMRRLFSTFITAEFAPRRRVFTPERSTNKPGAAAPNELRRVQGFTLRNIQLVEDAEVQDVWWNPQDPESTARWSGTLTLSPKFFSECLQGPIPVDLRVYKSLRHSPLAIDIYTWLTYRASYLRKPSLPIRWEVLMTQFGSSYKMDEQGIRNFRKAFARELKRVLFLYPARVNLTEGGICLLPSSSHIARVSASRDALDEKSALKLYRDPRCSPRPVEIQTTLALPLDSEATVPSPKA